MTVFREAPRCPFCNEVIAEGVYDTESQLYGDSFLHWEYEEHDCKEGREWAKKMREKFKL